MTTESTTMQERMVRQVLLRLNVHPNNQLCSEKWRGHYSSFVAMIQTYKKLLCMNPVATESEGEK